MDQLSRHLLFITAERGARNEDLLSICEMAKGFLPGFRRRMVPLIDDDEIEKIWRHSVSQASCPLAVYLLNVRVDKMALLKARLQCPGVVFANDGQVISAEDHVQIDPEIILQKLLSLPDALLRDQVWSDDQYTAFGETKRYDGNQSTFPGAGRQHDQRVLVGAFEVLLGLDVGLDLGSPQLVIAKDVGRRFGEVIHRQSKFLSAARANVPVR